MKTSLLLTKKQIAHSRYTRISNLFFIIPYHVTGSSPNASLWVYLSALWKSVLSLAEFEDSLDVCGKYGDCPLHLHGVKAIRLSPVIAIDML